MSPDPRRRWRRPTAAAPSARRRGWLAVLAGGLGIAAAVLLGTATAVLVAGRTARPAVFLGAGLLVTAGVAGAAVALALRQRPSGRRRRVAGGAAVVIGLVTAAAWLAPLADPHPGADSAEVRYWQLSTGSRLAYVDVPAARQPARPWPVVVLHGGPGIPDLPGDRAFWGQLAEDGFPVYAYAELGAGTSTRLADPAGYGIDRDVADLEEIRRTLRADRMVLVGHSYGGALAAAYLAAHPTHVASLVLSSPGPLDPADHSGDLATARLDLRQRLRLYPLALQPRALLGYLLLQVNPPAAHAYLPDAEADARNDAILSRAQSGLHCTAGPTLPPVTGSGFYRLQYPQSAAAPPVPDRRPAIAGRPTPTLVIKGGCDYQSWSSAEDYRRALPNTTLVYLPEAGHNTYQDEPVAVLAATRAFLAGRRPPIPPYTASTPPPDYQQR